MTLLRVHYCLLAAGLAVAVALTGISWAGEPGYGGKLSNGLIEFMVKRFGLSAKPQLLDWSEFLNQPLKAKTKVGDEDLDRDRRLIKVVNNYFNHATFIDDRTHWGAEDYWASPAEMVASNGGDCEDFSIAKYFALKELGVPITRIRITYVKAMRHIRGRMVMEAHMVLAYYPAQDAEPLILDNLVDEIKPSSERADLVPVYSFNDDDVLIASSGRSGGGPAQIRLWRELLDKLQREARL